MSVGLQQLVLSLLPASCAEAAEAESRRWMARCTCGQETSIWDLGGVRFKAVGNPRRLLRCAKCKQLAWHRISHHPETGTTRVFAEPDGRMREAKPRLQRRSAFAGIAAIVSLGLLISGTTFVAIGAAYFISVASHAATGDEVTGTIVQLVQRRDVHPVVQYSVAGVDYQIASKIGTSGAGYHVGQPVIIHYQVADPSDARIDDWVERGGPFLSLGAVLGIMGSLGLTLSWIAGAMARRATDNRRS